MQEKRETQPSILLIQLSLRLILWSTKSFLDHPLCAQQYVRGVRGSPALESTQTSGYKLDPKTNIRVLCSELRFQNLRVINAKKQHFGVAVGDSRLLTLLTV